jgi:hypothetical protein
VTTGDLDRPLRKVFRFEAADLAANRAGRLSPRQASLLHAGRMGMQLSLAVFVTVMLGSVGLVAFFNWRLHTTPGNWRGVGVAAAGALVVIVVGFVLSRRHVRAARSRQLSVARGPVEILSDASEDCRVRIGGTPLRLPGVAALQAFQPGGEYRVYYLAGPVAIVLSGEALAGGTAARELGADAEANAAERVAASEQLVVVRRGYLIVVLLGVLALGIPLAGVLVGELPARLRPIAWIGLLAVTGGFVWLALAWLTLGKLRGPEP